MTGAESRAMSRAAAVLLVSGLIRWGWERREAPPLLPDKPDALPELLEEARALRDEEVRRGTPLAEGERLDPNRAEAVELDRLPGVGPATAEAIVAAREAGAVFRRPEDLMAVRGIGGTTVERMRPWLELTEPPPVLRAGAGGPASAARVGGAVPVGRPASPSGYPAPRAPREPVDLNRASAEELQALPGVGPALAERILALRREKGRFTSVEALLEVRGIGPATLERLRRHIGVGAPRLH